MLLIKNRLVTKFLTVFTVLSLFFSFGLFFSGIISDNKVESVVIDYEPIHSFSSPDSLYYGTNNFVYGNYFKIGGLTNFILVDFLSFSQADSLTFQELLGSQMSGITYDGFLNYDCLEILVENNMLIYGLDLFSNDYNVLAYNGFSFDLSLFDSSSTSFYVGVFYDGTEFNSFQDMWDYALDKEIIYSDVASFYFESYIDFDNSYFVIPLDSAYELGLAIRQGNAIVDVITSTFLTLGLGILTFIKDGFTTLFLEVDGSGITTGLSDFGVFSFVLMGISLVMGLTYVIYNFVKRKR